MAQGLIVFKSGKRKLEVARSLAADHGRKRHKGNGRRGEHWKTEPRETTNQGNVAIAFLNHDPVAQV